MKSNQNLGVNFHLEDTDRPAYTYAGFVAGRASDVVVWDGEETPQAAARAIDGWFAAPFHRFPLLSTHLDQAVYGEYCEDGVCAAALNITSGAVWRASPIIGGWSPAVALPARSTTPPRSILLLCTHPTARPCLPEASTTTNCRSAVLMQWIHAAHRFAALGPLGSRVKAKLTAFSVTVNGAPVQTRGFDGSNYVNSESRTQEIARRALRSRRSGPDSAHPVAGGKHLQGVRHG